MSSLTADGPLPPLLTLDFISAFIRVDKRTLHRWINGGTFPAPDFPRVPTLHRWKRALSDAREAWIKEATTDLERVKRNRSDFLRYRDAMGRQADFHAGTRKTLCTMLNAAGIPLRVAMEIMRHTDAKLTMVDYVDNKQLATRQAVEGLTVPSLSLPPGSTPEATALAATGTDGKPQPQAKGATVGAKLPPHCDSLSLMGGLSAGFGAHYLSEKPGDNGLLTALVGEGELMGAVGRELPAEMAEKPGISAQRGTESGTVGDDSASNLEPADVLADAFPPDLAAVAAAWPNLPPAIRAGILAMVKAGKA